MEYRREINSGIWHWFPNCSNWPTHAFVSMSTRPPNGEFCGECSAKDQSGHGHRMRYLRQGINVVRDINDIVRFIVIVIIIILLTFAVVFNRCQDQLRGFVRIVRFGEIPQDSIATEITRIPSATRAVPTWTPIPIATATPRPTPTPSPRPVPTSTSEPTPTPTGVKRTEEEIEATLISLGNDALRVRDVYDRDAKLAKVVESSLTYGQFHIAFWAAKNGTNAFDQSEMLDSVAMCMAFESDFSWARYVASFMINELMKQETYDRIFELEYKSLRQTPPPSCRSEDWLRMPNPNQ